VISRRSWTVIVALTLLIAGCSEDREARSEILAVHAQLTPATSRSDLAAQVARSRLLFVSDAQGPTRWSIGTPLRLDARNWVLWVEFEGDFVRAARIRIYDSPTMHPDGAPPDIVFSR